MASSAADQTVPDTGAADAHMEDAGQQLAIEPQAAGGAINFQPTLASVPSQPSVQPGEPESSTAWLAPPPGQQALPAAPAAAAPLHQLRMNLMQWFQAQEAGMEPMMVQTMVQAQALEEPLQLLAEGMGMIERATAQIRHVIGQASRRPHERPRSPAGPPPPQDGDADVAAPRRRKRDP